NFPAGTILPNQLTMTLTLAPGNTGPAYSAVVSSVTTIAGSTRRITFQVAAGPQVSSPTTYLISVSGTTSTGARFLSGNQSSLVINPGPGLVSVLPNSGQPGQTLSVNLAGQFTTWVQFSTQASFGPGISVGNGPPGGFGPMTVSSPVAGTAFLTID